MARMSSPRAYLTDMLTVLDAQQRCIGFILPRGKTGFEAFNDADRSLGLFPTSQDAADVVLDTALRAETGQAQKETEGKHPETRAQRAETAERSS
jgi:hypothetical protein